MRLRALLPVALAAALTLAALALASDPGSPQPGREPLRPEREMSRPEPAPSSKAEKPPSRARPQAIRWRGSTAIGQPAAGRLLHGVRLPARGRHFETWDPVLKRRPDRAWRRWGTDRLVRMVLRAARTYRRAHPSAPPLLVGDLSRPHGGDFGPRFGSIGHMTHQNGLDVDLYYPRRDRRPVAARRIDHVDLPLSQALVGHVLRAGTRTVLVGPSTGLRGPPGRVKVFANHDDHLHARIGPG